MAEILENKIPQGTQDDCSPIEIKLFNDFIDKFILGKTSLLSQKQFDPNKDIENCLVLLKDIETMNKPDDKKTKEDKSLETALSDVQTSDNRYELLWHCYYIMYMMGETAKTFFKKRVDENSLFVERGKGVASTNQAYNSEAIRPFRTLLYLIKFLWNINTGSLSAETIKNKIIGALPKNKQEYGDCQNKLGCGEIDDRIKNILLYLCNPDDYVAIVSQTHKDNIWKYLSFLLQESQNYDENDLKTLEGIIKEGLKEEEKHEDFYHKTIRPFWDTPKISTKVDSNGNLSLNTLLTFKKAIVFFGPPGTSKTYTARELAKNVISIAFAEKLKKEGENKKSLFQDFKDKENLIFGDEEKDKNDEKILSHIHRLQLHPNYTYDDFIAGKMITASEGQTKIETQKGYLLKLIDKINDDKTGFKDLPHVVILDEINRVDISRIFGELFTAMESDYRKDGIDLPLTNVDGKPLKLIVPEKLYFIGTMNMIDFSLEQVDFALRRRFAWVENNYDPERLKDIIDNKIKKAKITEDLENDTANYLSSCSKLNEMISDQSNLGPAYQIGHTFFAEIIDIYEKMSGQDKWKSAKGFLWNISIKPMVEAYCGTMDSKAQKDFIKKCEETFFAPKAKR